MSARGFTLIELLVVLIIVGIITSLSVLGLAQNPQDRLLSEAKRFAALLQIAQQEALLSSTEYGIGVWETGYGFYTLQAGGAWQLVSGQRDKTLRERQLPAGMQIQLYVDGLSSEVVAAEDLEQPQLMVLSSAEMTAFELYFRDDEFQQYLAADLLGKIQFYDDSY